MKTPLLGLMRFPNGMEDNMAKSLCALIKSQQKLKEFKLENVEVFPGNIEKLLPFIKDNTIDSFIINIYNGTKKEINRYQLIRELFHSYKSKLVVNGKIQIILEKNQSCDDIISLIPYQEFKIINITTNNVPKEILYNKSIDLDKIENTKTITIEKINK